MNNFITLNNGYQIPQLGFGTIQQFGKQIEDNVAFALNHGYQLIDTANCYGNEVEVGKGLKQSGLKREDYYLETKLGPTLYENDQAIGNTLKRLGVDYIDVMILHRPVNNYIYAYKMLEKAYKEGKIKAIGVSNFYPDRLVDLALDTEVVPAVNQVEVNPFHQQDTALIYNTKYGVQLEAWAPFAEGKNGIFTNETLVEIGNKYNKSVGQVILRWLVQRGIVPLAKTVRKERMQENLNIFDFELSEEDMQTIASLNKDTSSFFSHYDPATVEMICGLKR